MLPQHLVWKYELNCEYCNITLARNKAPWWWSDKIETPRSVLKCFKSVYVRLYVHSLVDKLKWFYENARCHNKIYTRHVFMSCCIRKAKSRLVQLYPVTNKPSSLQFIWRRNVHKLILSSILMCASPTEVYPAVTHINIRWQKYAVFQDRHSRNASKTGRKAGSDV